MGTQRSDAGYFTQTQQTSEQHLVRLLVLGVAQRGVDKKGSAYFCVGGLRLQNGNQIGNNIRVVSGRPLPLWGLYEFEIKLENAGHRKVKKLDIIELCTQQQEENLHKNYQNENWVNHRVDWKLVATLEARTLKIIYTNDYKHEASEKAQYIDPLQLEAKIDQPASLWMFDEDSDYVTETHFDEVRNLQSIYMIRVTMLQFFSKSAGKYGVKFVYNNQNYGMSFTDCYMVEWITKNKNVETFPDGDNYLLRLSLMMPIENKEWKQSPKRRYKLVGSLIPTKDLSIS